MTLLLTLTGDGLPGPEKRRTLAAGSLSIGRSAGNDWVLPDPARILSKTHCVITAEDGQFVLTDLSSNGIYVNNAHSATSRDTRVVLSEGDMLRLGNYVIAVSKMDDDEPLPGAGRGEAADDEPPLIDPRNHRADPSFQHPITHVPATQRGEDPFDVEARRGARGAKLDDDLFHGAAPAGSWSGPPQSDHVPFPAQAMPPLRVVPNKPRAEIDLDALIGDLAPKGTERPSPGTAPGLGELVPGVAHDHAAQPYAAQPHAVRPAAPQEPAPGRAGPINGAPEAARTPSPVADRADVRAAFNAFLEGAGVQDQRIEASDPETALREAGKVFRAMVEGIRTILISRAAIKAEMGILQTIIRAKGNNTLKFSVTADDAVASLLAPGRPGYMDPLAAAEEALADIKSHELAVIVGVRNALETLLRRFDPEALERRMTKENLLGTVLPSARKARYWEAFRTLYNEISREAEDDFQSRFGRSFAEGYMTQTRHD